MIQLIRQGLLPITFLVFVITEFRSSGLCFEAAVGENADLLDAKESFMTLESGKTTSSFPAICFYNKQQKRNTNKHNQIFKQCFKIKK